MLFACAQDNHNITPEEERQTDSQGGEARGYGRDMVDGRKENIRRQRTKANV